MKQGVLKQKRVRLLLSQGKRPFASWTETRVVCVERVCCSCSLLVCVARVCCSCSLLVLVVARARCSCVRVARVCCPCSLLVLVVASCVLRVARARCSCSLLLRARCLLVLVARLVAHVCCACSLFVLVACSHTHSTHAPHPNPCASPQPELMMLHHYAYIEDKYSTVPV